MVVLIFGVRLCLLFMFDFCVCFSVLGFANEARKRGMSSCSERLVDIEKEGLFAFSEQFESVYVGYVLEACFD